MRRRARWVATCGKPRFDFSRVSVSAAGQIPRKLSRHHDHPPPFVATAAELRATVGHGLSVPSSLQNELSAQTGADLSNLRVHADARGDHLARVFGAEAVTFGNHVAQVAV